MQLSFIKWKVSFAVGKVCNICCNGAPYGEGVILTIIEELLWEVWEIPRKASVVEPVSSKVQGFQTVTLIQKRTQPRIFYEEISTRFQNSHSKEHFQRGASNPFSTRRNTKQ